MPIEADELDSDIERGAPEAGADVFDFLVVQVTVLDRVRPGAFFDFGCCRPRDDDGS
jgi:hypothetical protein